MINPEEPVNQGSDFIGVTFKSELQDGSKLGSTVYKELEFLCAQINGIFEAMGFDGRVFTNIITGGVTVYNNINQNIPPNIPPGTVTIVNNDGSTSSCCGGGDCTCPAAVPSGSLAFSGYGDSPIKFTTPNGTILTPPTSAPWIGGSTGSGGCAGFGTLLSGKYGATGVGYTTFNEAVLSADLSIVLGGASINSLSGFAASRDADVFYAITSPSNIVTNLLKFNNAGAQIGSFNLAQDIFPGRGPLGMIREDFAYFGEYGQNTVYAYDFSGPSTAVFVAEVGFKLNPDAPILVLPNGNILVAWKDAGAGSGLVRLYSPAGATIKDFTPSGAAFAPLTATLGSLTGTTFWLSYYTSSAATFSGCRVEEFEVSSGAIVNSFDPEDGTFEFDGPFCVARTPIAA